MEFVSETEPLCRMKNGGIIRFLVFGEMKNKKITIRIDGKEIKNELKIDNNSIYSMKYPNDKYINGKHLLEIEVCIDSECVKSSEYFSLNGEDSELYKEGFPTLFMTAYFHLIPRIGFDIMEILFWIYFLMMMNWNKKLLIEFDHKETFEKV